MRLSDARDQAPDKATHRFGAVPAHDVGRDFVADEIAEDAGMAPTVAHSGGYRLSNLGWIATLSRNAMCCDQGSPTRTFKPAP